MNSPTTENFLPDYMPKHYGKEYCVFKGSAQYPMFVATALGIKSVYDDWIPTEKLDEFKIICKQYGLHVEPDIIFAGPSVTKAEIAGSAQITTTFFEGRRFSSSSKEGSIHVFVSQSKEKAVEAKKTGWYPLIIGGRIFNKPYIDNVRFGRLLGYPECCIDFFRRFNDWGRYNHPHETCKNTLFKERPFASFYCNNFLMDKTYSYIHHLPCSYTCHETIQYAVKLEQAFQEVEPDFVEQMHRFASLPLLVFGERHFILFDGTLTKENESITINFNDAEYYYSISREEEKIPWAGKIFEADTLECIDSEIIAKKKSETLHTIKKNKEWFPIQFNKL